MHRKDQNDSVLKEVSAEIRNKIQPAITVLEMLRDGKDVSRQMIGVAIKDLEKVAEMIK